VPFCLIQVLCASAKTERHQSSIFGAMDTPMISANLTVDEVLQKWPRTFSVFMKNKTRCPGCFLQHFCTLKDVAETYQISSEKLINEIQSVADSEYIQRSNL
jgi:hybrid cluster-associated redox disulfide protein